MRRFRPETAWLSLFKRDSADKIRQPVAAMSYQPASTRYDNPALYRRCGRSGLKLPLLSLGLWHNFGAGRRFCEQPGDDPPRL